MLDVYSVRAEVGFQRTSTDVGAEDLDEVIELIVDHLDDLGFEASVETTGVDEVVMVIEMDLQAPAPLKAAMVLVESALDAARIRPMGQGESVAFYGGGIDKLERVLTPA